jgi:peptidyl-prolyl cis-trans isomerase C
MICRAGRIAAACLVLLTAMSCRHADTRTVIARVGQETLTLEEAQSRMGAPGRPSDDELRRFVAHWVNEELLYQEAQRRGFDGSEEFKQLLQDSRRSLLSQSFLDSQMSDTGAINDTVLQAYYEKHSEEFVVRNDMVKLNARRFMTRDKATQFASLITRGMTWNDAVTAASRDSADPGSPLPGVSGQFVSQHSVYPVELWKVALSLGTGELSFPVNTAAGFCVIQPLARLSAGSRAGEEVAAAEIRSRIQIDREREKYNQLLGTLRKRYSIEVMLPQSQQSDTLQRSHE